MNDLIIFKQFVDEITSVTSRHSKECILQKYKDNKDIRYLITFLYSKHITTGISKAKLNKKFDMKLKTNNDWKDPYSIGSFKELLEYLTINNKGTDYDVLTLIIWRDVFFYEFGQQLSLIDTMDNWIELFNCIVLKDLKLGVSARTINEVFG